MRLYTIRNGGHTFPQPHARFPRLLGRTHTGLDGPAEIWSFFARYPAPAASTTVRTYDRAAMEEH